MASPLPKPMNLRVVEIVGGGLAGLSLGLGLRARGIPVRIFEAGAYPRHRVCGEFITGLDEKTMHDLQLEKILRSARNARGVSWFEPGRAELKHVLPRPALCLSRYRLDNDMAEAFSAAQGELRTHERASATGGAGKVLACGRRPDTRSPWIGRKEHFRDLPLSNDLEVHLGRSAYVGLTRVEDGLVNVCGLFPRPGVVSDASLTSLARQAGLGDLAERMECAAPVAGSACATAGLDYRRAADGAASLGDHRGLIPPFTGHGMTIALQSAALALPYLESWSRGKVDWRTTESEIGRTLGSNFRRRIRWAHRLHPWLLGPRRRRIVHGLQALRILPLGALYRLCH